MKIIINNSYKQEGGLSTPVSSNTNLRSLFDTIVSEDPKISSEWVSENEVLLDQESSLQLHSFLLKAEQLGKKIQYSKQTIIKVID